MRIKSAIFCSSPVAIGIKFSNMGCIHITTLQLAELFSVWRSEIIMCFSSIVCHDTLLSSIRVDKINENLTLILRMKLFTRFIA